MVAEQARQTRTNINFSWLTTILLNVMKLQQVDHPPPDQSKIFPPLLIWTVIQSVLPKFETVLLIASGATSNASLSITDNRELPVTSGFI